jgi:XTP/dITP diphosphohydrolase
MRLLIATRNRGKKAEYADLLAGLDLELMSLPDLGIEDEVPEQGATFAENALAKARAYAALSGLVTLADDSGLEVDVLDGAPGVYSARYAGEGASDEDRYHRLLAELKGIPEARRTARFRCVIAVVWPDGRERIVAGACEGRIALEPRGEHGFGYDPVFYVPEYGCTMAELTPDVKNRISHRARAAEAARPLLVEDLG